MPRTNKVYVAIFALVLAPIAAAVVIAVLLLFGAKPEFVFAPGHFTKGVLEAAGVHAANRVGVLATVGCWWLLIVILGLAWSRRRSRSTRQGG